MKKLRRLFTIKNILTAISILFAGIAAAAAAIPGPQRAVCPTCFGLTKIDDDIYAETNDVKKVASLLQTVTQARQNVEDYLGGWSASPRIILCSRNNGPCDRLFGTTEVRGLTWGYTLVRLNPLGLNETIMTHELFHAELHYRMGQLGKWNNTIPRWFNEGLAVHLSQDSRFADNYSTSEMDWARSIVSLHDWRREVNAETWQTAYGASAQLVRDIEDKVDIDGIRDIIRRVTENGENFTTALTLALRKQPS